MANKKKKHKHTPLPAGMTYADKLARDRLVREAVEKSAKDHTVQLHSDIKTQRMMWLQITSVADYFGAGPKRMLGYLDTFGGNLEEFNDMAEKHGMDYALEKLRQRAEKATRIPIQYLYEKEIADARKRHEIKNIFFSVIEEEEM